MTFTQLGKEFERLVESAGDISADRFEGRWRLHGGTEHQRKEFTRLATIGGRMLGFVGSDGDAANYWMNRLKGAGQRKCQPTKSN